MIEFLLSLFGEIAMSYVVDKKESILVKVKAILTLVVVLPLAIFLFIEGMHIFSTASMLKGILFIASSFIIVVVWFFYLYKKQVKKPELVNSTEH